MKNKLIKQMRPRERFVVFLLPFDCVHSIHKRHNKFQTFKLFKDNTFDNRIRKALRNQKAFTDRHYSKFQTIIKSINLPASKFIEKKPYHFEATITGHPKSFSIEAIYVKESIRSYIEQTPVNKLINYCPYNEEVYHKHIITFFTKLFENLATESEAKEYDQYLNKWSIELNQMTKQELEDSLK